MEVQAWAQKHDLRECAEGGIALDGCRPFFAFYGIGADCLYEQIAVRRTYAEEHELALKLAPGVAFLEAWIQEVGATFRGEAGSCGVSNAINAASLLREKALVTCASIE